MYEIGLGKSKKGAKSESAKKAIEMIAHIPDAQSVIISIMMSSNLNETFLMNPQDGGPKKGGKITGPVLPCMSGSKMLTDPNIGRVFNLSNYRTDFPSMTAKQK